MNVFSGFISSIILLAACVCSSVGAKSQDDVYQRFTTVNGLPSPDVYFVHEDVRGYLWFCTDRGVSRYNGYEFENFDITDGLTHSTVFSISEAPNHDLWMHCYDGSISIWSHKKQQFSAFRCNPILQKANQTKWITQTLFTDSATYLIPTPSRGFIFIQDSAHEPCIREVETEQMLEVVYDGPKQKVGVIKLDSSITFALFPEGKKAWEVPRIILKLEDGSFLIAHEQFLYLYAPGVQKLRTVYQSETHIQAAILENGKLYIADLDGIQVMDVGRFQPIRRILENHRVTWLAIDRDQNLWATIEKRGAVRVSDFNLGDIEQLQLESHLGENESIESIASIHSDIVLGTNQGQFLIFDRKGRQKSSYRVPNQEVNRKGVISQLLNRHDTVYGSTFLRIDKHNDTYRHTQFSASQINTKFVLPLANGEFLYANTRDVQVARKTEAEDLVPNLKLNFTERILFAHQDGSGTIWMASHNAIHQVRNYDYSEVHPFSELSGLGQVTVRDIESNNQGLVFMASIGHGLIVAHEDQFIKIGEAVGLGGDIVNSIFATNDSVIWCGGNYGISRVELALSKTGLPAVKRINNYDPLDGIPASFIKQIIGVGSRIWILTDRGVFHFSPDEIKSSLTPPLVRFEDARTADGFALEPGIKLDDTQNNIHFSILGISHVKPLHDEFYRYRLAIDGEKGEWLKTNNRGIWLNNLVPGAYALEVTAVSKNGIWATSQTFPFVVQAHFSETAWFRGLLLVALIGLLFYLVRSRESRLKREEKTKQDLQDARIRAKQAELSMLRNQMNPHFIFNALTSIQKYILKQDVEMSIKYLSRFSKLMRTTLHYTSIDFINVEEELDFISNYLEIERTRFPGLFDYHVSLDENINPTRIWLPTLLLQPVLENCVKHAFKSRESSGLIDITFRKNEQGDRLIITIEDNGLGYDSGKQDTEEGNGHQSFGLGIVRERIEIMNSRQHEKAEFKIINKQSFHEHTQGTLVKFILPWITKNG